MPIIVITIIMMYIILIIWCNHNLENMETYKKIIFIATGILVIYVLTNITFNISKNGIGYPNNNMVGNIKNILVWVFTGVNAIFILPYLSTKLKAVYQEELKVEQFIKKTVILIIVLVVLLTLECGYMKDTQKVILEIFEHKK